MKKVRMRGLTLASVLVLGACKGGEAPAADQRAATPSADSTGGMAGMPGMSGMSGMSGGTMEAMESHLSVMTGTAADSMPAMLPAHRQMVANMLSEFNREMQQMNMTADASWNALADSVRADLTRMPEVGTADLKTMMEGHAGRVRRLMEMHRSMGGGMKM
jgi:hypothetical protein